MKYRNIYTLIAALTISSLWAENSIEKTRNVIEQWVETEQIISEEKSDWILEKSILGDTQVLLSKELTRIEKAIDDLEDSATAADARRPERAVCRRGRRRGTEPPATDAAAREQGALRAARVRQETQVLRKAVLALGLFVVSRRRSRSAS